MIAAGRGAFNSLRLELEINDESVLRLRPEDLTAYEEALDEQAFPFDAAAEPGILRQ